jgi:polyisoprenoid-binding protein YceI
MLANLSLAGINDSFISYIIHHPFKDVSFKSNEQNTAIVYNESNDLEKMDVSVDIKTLKSGIAWIDEWELKIVEWNKFNKIEFKSNKITMQGGTYLVEGIITFHGVSKTIVIPTIYDGNVLAGTFDLRITDFSITKPKPFGIPVNDYITVSFRFQNGDDNGK